jgi:hypothetical protein
MELFYYRIEILLTRVDNPWFGQILKGFGNTVSYLLGYFS